MARFSDDFASVALPALMHEFADAVVFHAPNATATNLSAMLGPVEEEIVEDADGRTRQYARNITIGTNPSDDFGGMAEIAERGYFTIDGDNWGIVRIVEQSAATIVLRLARPESETVGRLGYHALRR